MIPITINWNGIRIRKEEQEAHRTRPGNPRNKGPHRQTRIRNRMGKEQDVRRHKKHQQLGIWGGTSEARYPIGKDGRDQN